MLMNIHMQLHGLVFSGGGVGGGAASFVFDDCFQNNCPSLQSIVFNECSAVAGTLQCFASTTDADFLLG